LTSPIRGLVAGRMLALTEPDRELRPVRPGPAVMGFPADLCPACAPAVDKLRRAGRPGRRHSIVLCVGFLMGGLRVPTIVAGGPPVPTGSVAMQVAASGGLSVGGPLMTLSHLLVQLRCSITRSRTIAR
jgi:hypothetical protein